MKKRYEYTVKDFIYSKQLKSFYADAWDLCSDEHKGVFPSDREQFYLINPNTGGYRRFTFDKQNESHYLFKSEDGIRCVICINPNFYEKEREVPFYGAGN